MEQYDFAITVAKEAGALLLEKKQSFSVSVKHDNQRDVVTSLDIEIGQFITSRIRKAYPAHGICNEEAEAIEGNEYLWTIDPIDGTSSFARGIPQYAIAIGLIKNGQPIVGVVYDPMTQEIFSFEKGEGAFLNNERIQVSTRDELRKAFVLFAPGRNDSQFEWAGESLKKLLVNTGKVKNFGSSALALCYIAAGRLEGVVMGTMTGVDGAPAIGILREAGGEILDRAGQLFPISGDTKRMYAANSLPIAEQLRVLLELE
jgi:myo-inositol-1(or 4)-monophosphatase